MIGGLGPESSIDYYRSILAGYRSRTHNRGYPQIIINSLDVDKGIAMLDANRLDELGDYLATGLEALVRAGADLGFIAANTPHLVFDEVQRRSAIPLLSIVRATADRAKMLGFKKVGLFGTGFTMRADFYPKEFERVGITLVTPKETGARIHSQQIHMRTSEEPAPPGHERWDFGHRSTHENGRGSGSDCSGRNRAPAAATQLGRQH